MQRWQSNVMQLLLLASLGFIASKDVDRTIRQNSAVSPAQTEEFKAHIERLQKR